MHTLSTTSTSSLKSNEAVNDDITEPFKEGNIQCYIYKRTVRKGKKSEQIFLLQNLGNNQNQQPASLKGRATVCGRVCIIMVALIVSSLFFMLYNSLSSDKYDRY